MKRSLVRMAALSASSAFAAALIGASTRRFDDIDVAGKKGTKIDDGMTTELGAGGGGAPATANIGDQAQKPAVQMQQSTGGNPAIQADGTAQETADSGGQKQQTGFSGELH